MKDIMDNSKSVVEQRKSLGKSVFTEPDINIKVYKDRQDKIPFHKHDFFEFVYVDKGFMVHNHNGRTHVLTAGDVFCIVPGQIHMYTMGYEAVIYNILFEKSEFGTFLDQISSLGILKDIFECREDIFPNIKISIPKRHELIALLDTMIQDAAEKKCGWHTALRIHMLEFLLFFVRAHSEAEHEIKSDTGKKAVYYGYILKTLKFVEENYMKDINSADIAENVGISSDYITKQFKKELDMTPLDYLRKYRIAKSIELIKTTDMSISDVSVACGFNDLSLFSRVFKQTFGLTPRDFKKDN